MWAGQDPRSDRSMIGIVVFVCRVPPTNHIPWCHRGKTSPNMWSKVEGLVMCVMHCGVRGHVARFCSERRLAQSRYYEQPPVSPRRNSPRGSGRWTRDTYFGSGFQQNPRSDTSIGNGFRQTTRGDLPSSVRSLTPPTVRQRRSPSPSRRAISPPPGN